MKKIMFFAAFAAALILSSCNKEPQTPDVSVGSRTIHFTAVSPETKTVFGDKNGSKYPVLWQDTDVVAILVNKTDKISVNVEPAPNYKSASFSATVSDDAETFTFVSPNTSLKDQNADRIMVEIPSSQTSTSTGPDSSAQILYAYKEADDITDYSNVEMEFAHLTAYMHICFENVDLDGGTVQAVNITCSGDENASLIAGRFNYYYDGGFNGNGSSRFNTISINTNKLEHVWCAVRPVDFSSKTLSLTIITDKGTLSRDVTMPAAANLAAGHIAKFSVDMSAATVGDLVYYDLITDVNNLHWGDEVIVATALEDYPFAIGRGQNTNNRSGVGVTFSDNCISNPSDIVEILRIEDGAKPGYYALHATVNQGYLYAYNHPSGTNSLRTQSGIDLAATWGITFGNVTYNATSYTNCAIIKSQTTETTRNLLRYNPSDNLFTVYGNTNWVPVRMYRKRQENPDTSPRFNVTLPEGNMAYSSAAVEVPVYVFGNVDWTASVSGGSAVFEHTKTASASGTGNSILSLSLPALSSTVESFTLTVSTSESVAKPSFVFTVKHAKSIAVNDVLFHEQYWTGSEKDQKLTQYQASGNASTVVYGGAEIVYSQDGSSQFMAWDGTTSGAGNVFLPTPYKGELSTEGMEINLRIQKNGGYLKASGIPCTGVKNATLTYKLNRNGVEYTASSDTDGVSVGAMKRKSGTSDWGKDYTEYSYPLSFDDGLNKFNFTITDSHASNHVYIADIKIVVTAVY